VLFRSNFCEVQRGDKQVVTENHKSRKQKRVGEQKVFPTGGNPHVKRLTIHLDNGSIQTSRTAEECIRQDNLIRLQHPLNSLDLAPSDFYLFLTIKAKPKDIQMVDEKDLFYRLQEILNSISRKELDKVVDTWINRLMIGKE
jgi:hypothetical protein